MKFHYVSVWKAVDTRMFELIGVVGASTDQVQVYSPCAELDPSLASLQRAWAALRGTRPPVEWLEALASTSGSDVYEYSDVRKISAASLDQALVKAFRQTEETYGGTLANLYERVAGEVQDLEVIDLARELENADPT